MALTPALRLQLDNLPGFPRAEDFLLGDYLERVQGNPNVPLGGPQTINISSTGSDTQGDGSIANPYRQPERAMLDINHGSSGNFAIDCLDDGPYIPPAPTSIRGDNAIGLNINIIGNRQVSNRVATWPGAAPPLTPIAGKHAQFTTVSNGYVVAITDGSHWIVDESVGFETFPTAANARGVGVASPTLIAMPSSGALFGTPFLLPLTTVFNFPTDPLGIFTGPGASGNVLGNDSVTVQFIGIQFTKDGGFPSIINCNLFSCRSPGMTFIECDVVDLADPAGEQGSVFGNSGAAQTRPSGIFPSYGMRPGNHFLSDMVMHGIINLAAEAGGMEVTRMDAETGAAELFNSVFGDARIGMTGNISIDGPWPIIVKAAATSRMEFHRVGGILNLVGTGAVATTTYELAGNNHASGLAASDPASISVGTDVKVGSRAAAAYATLPNNDFQAATGTGCVVAS